MRTGLTKQEKTIGHLGWRERSVYPDSHPQHRWKKRCMESDIEKGRFSFRLTTPCSEERWKTASKVAKAIASNSLKSVICFFEKLFSFI